MSAFDICSFGFYFGAGVLISIAIWYIIFTILFELLKKLTLIYYDNNLYNMSKYYQKLYTRWEFHKMRRGYGPIKD